MFSDIYYASLTRSKMPVIKSRAFNLENVSYDTHKDIDVRGFGEYFGVCVTAWIQNINPKFKISRAYAILREYKKSKKKLAVPNKPAFFMFHLR